MNYMLTFLFHPPGITENIIGWDCGIRGRSCYAHQICGSLLIEDVVVHFIKLQILVDGKESLVISNYHVSDGIDCCCVGFIKSELTKFSNIVQGVWRT